MIFEMKHTHYKYIPVVWYCYRHYSRQSCLLYTITHTRREYSNFFLLYSMAIFERTRSISDSTNSGVFIDVDVTSYTACNNNYIIITSL